MVGRNDPCPCGSRKKYQKCCGGNIVFIMINQILKYHYRLIKLQKSRFQQIHAFRLEIQGSIHFEPLLPIPQDQQIPQNYLVESFQHGLYSEAHLFKGMNSRKQQKDLYHDDFSKQECLTKCFCDGSYTCNKIVDIREESIIDQIHPIPYTSFAHEMRGEILVQLEKYNKHDEERQDFIAHNGWRVLGWSIKRAKELEQIEKLVVSNDRLGIEQLHTQPSYEQKGSLQTGLSDEIMGHFDQFYMTCVAPLQGRTQALYGRSMELLYQYLSARFGKSFGWSMLNEESLIHFLSVWYLDQNNPTPVAAKVFLNTLKKLFYWLSKEKIADINSTFQHVYIALIRTLPITIEARKWLKENGVHHQYEHQQNLAEVGVYQLATSSSGPVVSIDDKWMPIKLNGYPPMWQESGFWIRGSIEVHNGQVVFTRIENVYPVVTIGDTHRMMNQS